MSRNQILYQILRDIILLTTMICGIWLTSTLSGQLLQVNEELGKLRTNIVSDLDAKSILLEENLYFDMVEVEHDLVERIANMLVMTCGG